MFELFETAWYRYAMTECMMTINDSPSLIKRLVRDI